MAASIVHGPRRHKKYCRLAMALTNTFSCLAIGRKMDMLPVSGQKPLSENRRQKACCRAMEEHFGRFTTASILVTYNER
jgi:hypothetical protein